MKINTGLKPAQTKMLNRALKTLMKSENGLAVLLQSLLLPLLAQQGGVSLPSTPGFGGGGGGGQASAPAIGNFLGGGGGGGGATASASRSRPGSVSAKSAGMSEIRGGSAIGKKIAAEAQRHATGSGGYCFKYVGESLRKFGINTSGASAYMAADQLAKNPKVKEVKAAPQNFKKLPPGAIVVWDKGPGHPHGHISIALGNGKEASDVIRDQITTYGTKARVFMPKK
ncbi:MAG: hypothetical protein WC314_27270 [Vulcanimicrobiota bacterium]